MLSVLSCLLSVLSAALPFIYASGPPPGGNTPPPSGTMPVPYFADVPQSGGKDKLIHAGFDEATEYFQVKLVYQEVANAAPNTWERPSPHYGPTTLLVEEGVVSNIWSGTVSAAPIPGNHTIIDTKAKLSVQKSTGHFYYEYQMWFGSMHTKDGVHQLYNGVTSGGINTINY